ncbi:GNAT family N-acetyltransferase [Nocardioides sp. AX2bis]|uniref:GNAT family N-acetyltransferase n=1 Tax=Nocardioides sp. AX2bis TaxID=2653157 RepID=UPI0012F0CD7E|nr:GNAT family N-acetyltransferase [Nocardioides sp. AX2bis]VXB19191.1 Ribosomal protein S18 acetylase RimI [Nocardioides sp. AX2bis]
MRVRRVREDELARVGAMTVAAYAPFLSPDDPYALRLADAARRDREAEVWVAVDEAGQLVGNVTVCPSGSVWRELAEDDEGELRMLAVDPVAQRRGVGEILTTAVVERFRAEGATAVVLSSMPTMDAAHRLYERLGFTRRPDRDWAPLPDVALIAYARELP